MKTWYSGLLVLALATPSVSRAQLPEICGPLPGPIPIPQLPGVIAPGPFAFVRVDNVCVNLSPLITLDVGKGLFELLVPRLVVDGGLITNLEVTFDPDPYASFSGSSSNLTAGPTAYTFYFGTPIAPGFYGSASSTASVSLTSGDQGSATIAQDGAAPFVTARGSDGATLVPLGVDIGTGTCTAGLASNTCKYPPPSGGPATSSFGAPVFLDNLEVTLSYTQTDANSQAAWSGRADVFRASVSSVPEPGTVALGATGLLAAAGVGAGGRRTGVG
jgi:hypothetical protein